MRTHFTATMCFLKVLYLVSRVTTETYGHFFTLEKAFMKPNLHLIDLMTMMSTLWTWQLSPWSEDNWKCLRRSCKSAIQRRSSILKCENRTKLSCSFMINRNRKIQKKVYKKYIFHRLILAIWKMWDTTNYWWNCKIVRFSCDEISLFVSWFAKFWFTSTF